MGSQVKIEINFGPTGTKITVDGVEQQNVFDVRFHHEVGNMPVLTLRRWIFGEVSGETEVIDETFCGMCRQKKPEGS